MKSNLLCQHVSTLLLATVLTISIYGCGKTPATTESPTSQPLSPTATGTTPAESATSPTEPPSNRDPAQTPAQNPIPEGDYAMGGTDQGLEVRGNQYRYYDEAGEHEWQPTSQLTAINPGHVFDGENYWCHSDNVPEGGGICTANGWQAYSSVGQLSADELSLGGVEAGAREAEVIAALGQPDQIDQVSPFSSQLTYRGLSVSFYEDAALNLRSVRGCLKSYSVSKSLRESPHHDA
ncbi:MAG: hypothetical protein O2890_10450, partial [Cyanobacteria bacterium]|nr:hypothetical protein [Cyanobacteriota bacterium]